MEAASITAAPLLEALLTTTNSDSEPTASTAILTPIVDVDHRARGPSARGGLCRAGDNAEDERDKA